MVRTVLLLLVGIVAISTASILIKICNAPALVIAAYRVGLASLILIPLAVRRATWKEWRTEQLGWCILSGAFLSLHFASWIASLKYTSVASSVVLVTTHPIFVGLAGWLFLRERLSFPLILGIAFSVLGSGLIGYGDMALSREAVLGDALALLGAVAASGYLLLGRRSRKDQGLLSYIFPVYSTAAIALVILCLLSGAPLSGYSPSTYLVFFLLAVIPQLIGHTTFNWALKLLPASIVAVTILGEPIGSTTLAYLFLDEGLTLWKLSGGISIFIGIIIALAGEQWTDPTPGEDLSTMGPPAGDRL